MAKPLSAKIVIKILCKKFGFSFVSQKGSHIKLEKMVHGKQIITIIPNYKELSNGTLKGILGLAEITEKEFREKLKF